MLNVLLVEDDNDFRFLFSRMLTKTFNCKVTTATNGLEGLSRIAESLPDVIFLDVNMPIMNGLEMLEIVKADPDYKDLNVIMLTAISDKSAVKKIVTLGVTEYLLKPIMYAETRDRLTELFEGIKKDKKAAAQEKKLVEPILQGMKLLLVEKDKKLRESVKEKINRDITLVEADNGIDGLRLFFKMQPEIICIGENLGLINPKNLAKKIRSVDREHKFSIIMMGNDNPDEDMEYLYDKFIKKGDTTSEIATEISSISNLLLRI